MNLIIEDLKQNINYYSLIFIFFAIILIISYFLLKDMIIGAFDNHYIFLVIAFFSASFGLDYNFKTTKMMYFFAKLPINVGELFLVRFFKSYLIIIIFLMFLFVLSFFDNEVLEIDNAIYILNYLMLSFIYFAINDFNKTFFVTSQFKKFLRSFVIVILFSAPLLLALHIIESNESIFMFELWNVLIIVIYFFYGFTANYYIFKKRRYYRE